MARISYFGLFLFYFLKCMESKIVIVTGNNLQKLQNEGIFMMIYVTKGDCEYCRQAYPKFLTASETFDPEEVMFGRIQHVGLAAKFDVEDFPTLIYFKANSKIAKRAKIDITVESIIQFISDATVEDYVYRDKQYTVDLTPDNFDEILDTPRQFKLVLLFRKEMDKEKVDFFQRMGKIYKNDDKVIFCRLDVEREFNLKGRFKMKTYPAMYWITDDEIPKKFIYGGRYEVLELMNYIASKTGIKRKQDGMLEDKAGVLEDFEKLFKAKEKEIIEAKDLDSVVQEAKTMAELYEETDQKEYANYYVYLLEEVQWHEDTSAIDDENIYIIEELVKDIGPKQRETLRKKQNIVRGIMDLFGSKMSRRTSKQSPIVKKKGPRPHVHEKKQHIHRHEEL